MHPLPLPVMLFKATMRGSFALAISAARKASRSKQTDAEHALRTAEHGYSSDPSPGAYSDWKDRARQLELTLLERTKKKNSFIKVNIFLNLGIKNSHLLACLNQITSPVIFPEFSIRWENQSSRLPRWYRLL